jgi:hypothetical protein
MRKTGSIGSLIERECRRLRPLGGVEMAKRRGKLAARRSHSPFGLSYFLTATATGSHNSNCSK